MLVTGLVSAANTNKPGVYLGASIGGSYNYLGLMTKEDLYYMLPLFDMPGALWETTKLSFGVQQYTSPSFGRSSVFLKAEPIALFDLALFAGYEYQFPALSGGLFQMSGPDADYSQNARNGMQAGPLSGFRAVSVATFKIGFGDFAALYSWTADYHQFNTNVYLYDAATFTIHKGEDTTFTHDVKALYKFGELRVGVNWNDVVVLSSGYFSMLAAGMLVYTPKWEFLGPDVTYFGVLLAGTHLIDRYMVLAPYVAAQAGLTVKLF